MSSTNHWYGARTLYRISVEGDPAASVVEERVVLVAAMDADSAIEKAEAEAAEYCSDVWLNSEGARVVTRYLGTCDVFAMRSEPGDAVEAYSSLVDVGSETDDELVTRFFGGEEPGDRSRLEPDPERTAAAKGRLS